MYADYLSRKPIQGQPIPAEQVEVKVMLVEGEEIINSKIMALETKKHPILSKVLEFTRNGWPESPQSELQPYYSKRLELSTEDGICCGIHEPSFQRQFGASYSKIYMLSTLAW